MRYSDHLSINEMSPFQLMADGFADLTEQEAVEAEVKRTEQKIVFTKPEHDKPVEKTPVDYYREGYDLMDKVRLAEALRLQVEREKRQEQARLAAKEAALREQAEILKMALGYE